MVGPLGYGRSSSIINAGRQFLGMPVDLVQRRVVVVIVESSLACYLATGNPNSVEWTDCLTGCCE
jgi:Na+/proline symporter